MHEDILTSDQVAVLEGLSRVDAAGGFYLAGGAALALRHGHRRSVVFDFFRETPFDVMELERRLEQAFPALERLQASEDTLYVCLAGVTTSFFRLRYPLLEPPEATRWGFGLASDADLAAMKLEAVAGRGSRKDFVDLWTLCRLGWSLEQVFAAFERKYGAARTDRYHRLRALAYFEDAEREPMPDLLAPLAWEELRAHFRTEASRLLAAGYAD